MRNFLVSIILGLSLSLGACTSFPTSVRPVEANATVQQKLQVAIDNANAAIAAAASTVLSNYQQEALTEAEAKKLYNRLVMAGAYVDAAEALNKQGDIQSAQGQLNLAQALLNATKSRLIELSKKGN